MTAGGGSPFAVAGGPAPHIPVLAARAIEYLAVRPDGIYLDATFGAGGYTRAMLAAGAQRIIGIDRDQSAIAGGFALVEEAQGRLELIEARFSELERSAREAGVDAVDGIVFDLGVSSMQLDTAARGFSFRIDGPLDMRMSHDGRSAADIIANATERDLAVVIKTLGEERYARAVARAIVKARAGAPITTTAQLADIVASVVRSRPGAIHPATRTFQALRMAVNDELGEIAAGLTAAERLLKPQGRLVVVSFHSLEDRLVKGFLTERGTQSEGSRHRPQMRHAAPTFTILTRKAVTPDDDEIARNPRARSAKLRAASRTEAPPRERMPDLVPSLPTLDDLAGR
jgi:16S rRNA (cytosine1402-N4)-methyltransferase